MRDSVGGWCGDHNRCSDGDHNGTPQRSSVTGQRWKLLLMPVPMHWAQVWGTMMGQKLGP